MLEIVHTDPDGVEQGMLTAYALDLAYGADENDFELTLPEGVSLEAGSRIYIDGTEWGGIVRGGRESTLGGSAVTVATGETWHGRLASTYICPAGSHVDVDGDANDALRDMVRYVGLQDVFEVSAEPSGFRVRHRFDRFTDCYSGFRKMLQAVGAKLRIDKQPGRNPELSAVEAGVHIDDGEAGRYGYEISWDTPVNHLICLGTGELEERIVIHLYADSEGRVSEAQTLFGLDERQLVYDYSNAGAEQLMEDGVKKLVELQSVDTCELILPEEAAYDVGDTVGIVSERSGRSVVATVSKVIVKVDSTGIPQITNEVGEATRLS